MLSTKVSAMVRRMASSPAPAEASPPDRPDRRARRRQETITEILDIAVEVMGEEGVNGLSLSEVARRLGVQPPSLYKYFDSLLAVYDAIFERGMAEMVEVMHEAMDAAPPGLRSLAAGLEANGRWCLEHPVVAQLLFWRPVPGFAPSDAAFAHSQEMVEVQRVALADAVAAGELGPGAASDEGIGLVSIMIAGSLSQAMANEPGVRWGEGRFTPLFPTLLDLLPAAYPPA
jgi:AcrR family transcriptional regulator